MGDHPRPQVPACERQETVQEAENRDHDHVLQTLITVRDAEEDGLREDGDRRASGQSVKLLLQVAAENRLLAEAGGQGKKSAQSSAIAVR